MQDELLELWKKSWSDKGFEAIVLTKADAEKHPFYTEFIKKIENLHLEIAEFSSKKYGLACWVRWLAYATQPEEKFYVCDYDVINHNFNPIEPDNDLTLLEGDCPCIASGTPSQFEALCKTIISFTENNLEKIKEIYKERKYKHFHDQEFFMIGSHINKALIKMTRDRNIFCGIPGEGDFWNKQIVHYSHSMCHYFSTRSNSQLVRVLIVERFLQRLNK